MNRTKSLAALVIALLAMLALVPSAGAAPSDTTAYLTNIRVGAHPTYDRVVLDVTNLPSSYAYTPQDKLYYDPSGQPVNIPGRTFGALATQGATEHTDSGQLTYTGPQTFTTPQLTNVRAVAVIGDFEKVLSIGLGLRHAAHVHVFTLTGPNRLVIDVDH
jgi:hypothetical protein